MQPAKFHDPNDFSQIMYGKCVLGPNDNSKG